MLRLVTIGISANILKDAGGMFPGYERCYVNQDYIHTIVKHHAVPIVLPVHESHTLIPQQLAHIDGLILSGGQDVSPSLYDEEPYEKLGPTLLKRDLFDYKLIQAAKEKGIPILGICRGAQLINVYHGGTLYQDLSYREQQTLRHHQGQDPTETTHTVHIEPTSRLAHVFETDTMRVNSFHHQAINKVAPQFKVAASTSDGVVEAIESTDYPYLLGIQWHPEMLWRDTTMDQLISDFINICESK
ncbi:gamma-glutamyl-gamma-aminobutyrate hydrolase family protein [Staphylococcus delphini]|uniref:gamma-glutamyl-gamma-aminobutyrate hydrolase family protein n=1 Tax=Staphylococcus delphini TaxID=53344 RepID=UPI00374E724B